MMRQVIIHHLLIVGWNYAKGRCNKSEFQCAMEYLDMLQKRVDRHYKRLTERN